MSLIVIGVQPKYNLLMTISMELSSFITTTLLLFTISILAIFLKGHCQQSRGLDILILANNYYCCQNFIHFYAHCGHTQSLLLMLFGGNFIIFVFQKIWPAGC